MSPLFELTVSGLAEGQSAAQRVLEARALRFEQLLDAIPTDDRASVVHALQLLRNASNVIGS